MNAIILSNALVYASPSYDKKDSHKKQQMWNKFMDGFEWNKIKEQGKKKSTKELTKAFGMIGIPVKKKGDK